MRTSPAVVMSSWMTETSSSAPVSHPEWTAKCQDGESILLAQRSPSAEEPKPPTALTCLKDVQPDSQTPEVFLGVVASLVWFAHPEVNALPYLLEQTTYALPWLFE